jgi:Lon-like protease
MQSSEWDLPEPPGIRPVKERVWWKWPAIILAGVILAGASFYIPLPMYYAYLPGPVSNIEELVDVTGATTYSSEGELLMTTVSVDTEVTVADFIGAMVNDDTEIVLKEQLTQGGSLERLREEQRQEMEQSKQWAREVALTSLGIARGEGAEVLGLLTGYPAEEFLEESDVIVAIDGTAIETRCDVTDVVRSTEVGDELSITVERDGKRRTFAVETVQAPTDPQASFVGVEMGNFRFDPGVEVTFETGEIAGPSAGLMMSLALYDRLTPGDLTNGRVIAGTGELDCGRVAPIGGISQKVAGAEEEGAEIFLAPLENAEQAEEAAGDIEIIAVGSFEDALQALEGLR